MNYIKTGFFNNFKGHDSLLLSMNLGGLAELKEVFLQLSEGLSQLDFNKLAVIHPNLSVPITAILDIENHGARAVAKDRYEWRLDADTWFRFSQMLAYQYEQNNGGHHYLDFQSADVDFASLQVVASLDEYPDWFWEEHFPKSNFLPG